MEKCREPYYIYIRMRIQESAQTLHRMCPGLWLAHIKGNLRFYILPFIYDCIVHVYRIPHNISQEAYGIFMKRLCRSDNHISGFFHIAPQVCGDGFSGSAIHNLPPSVNIISRIYLQHIRIQMIHQMNLQLRRRRCMERSHNIHLLNFFRICFRPCIVFTGCVIGCIDFGTRFL